VAQGQLNAPRHIMGQTIELIVATATADCITATLLFVVAFFYFDYLRKHDNLSFKQLNPTLLMDVRLLHFLLFSGFSESSIYFTFSSAIKFLISF